jgi:hypothetical protein
VDEKIAEFTQQHALEMQNEEVIEIADHAEKLSEKIKNKFHKRLLWLNDNFVGYFSEPPPNFDPLNIHSTLNQGKIVPKLSIPLRAVLQVSPTSPDDYSKYKPLSKSQHTSFKIVFVKKDTKRGIYKPSEKDIPLPVSEELNEKQWKSKPSTWYLTCTTKENMTQWVNSIALNVFKKNSFVKFDITLMREYLELRKVDLEPLP